MFFFLFPEKYVVGTHWGTSNEYYKMFLWRNKKQEKRLTALWMVFFFLNNVESESCLSCM